MSSASTYVFAACELACTAERLLARLWTRYSLRRCSWKGLGTGTDFPSYWRATVSLQRDYQLDSRCQYSDFPIEQDVLRRCVSQKAHSPRIASHPKWRGDARSLSLIRLEHTTHMSLRFSLLSASSFSTSPATCHGRPDPRISRLSVACSFRSTPISRCKRCLVRIKMEIRSGSSCQSSSS